MTRRWIVTKSFSFDSAHQLPLMPEGHPCANVHGHTYNVDVSLSATALDEHGMVMDFNHFRELKAMLDHKNLNEVLPVSGVDDEYPQPTSEILCKFIWDWIDRFIWQKFGVEGRKAIQILRVRVSETASSYAELVLE